MTDQLVPLPAEGCIADRHPFRPIHYLGSKLRLLTTIEQAVADATCDDGPVCDLFSGSGIVAARLGAQRPVVAVDIQEYSRVLAAAMLEPPRLSARAVDEIVRSARAMQASACAETFAALAAYEERSWVDVQNGDARPLCTVLEHGSLVAFEHERRGVPARFSRALRDASELSRKLGATLDGEPALARYFGGVYFSYRQAFALQCALAAVRTLAPQARDFGLAAVISTASELVTTVGNHFAQPIRPRHADGRPKRRALTTVASRRRVDAIDVFSQWLDRYYGLPRSSFAHEARQADYRDFLASDNGKLSAVYADPPYTRDHYSRFYHVLETIARQDDPGISTMRLGGETRVSRGLYRSQRHQSPFCIKSQAPGAFSDLFAGVRRLNVPLILSYSPYDSAGANRPRLMTIEHLRLLADGFFSEVDVLSAGPITHSKLNAAHLNVTAPAEAEVLLVCRP